MGLTSGLVELAVAIIERLGYVGVFILMVLESMVAPVPSEGVMPFAGFLVAQGKMDFWTVVLVSTVASVVGSWLSYELGKHLGRPFVKRWGRYVFVSEHDLDLTDRFFKRWGVWAIFVGRFIPVVRHLISIPAGVARMKMAPFLAATAVGAFGWNAFLTWVGVKLGQNWDLVKDRMEPFDYAILAILVLVGVWFVAAHVKRARRAGVSLQEDASRSSDNP